MRWQEHDNLFLCSFDLFILNNMGKHMIYTYDKKTLEPKSAVRKIAILILSLTLVSSLLFYREGYKNGKNVLNTLTPEDRIIILNNYDKFTPEKFKAYLEELNVPHADIVYAQALLETGNFTSHIFKTNNNLFGMKVATIRPTTNIGEENGHAVFKHWRQSVVDYALYSSCYLTKMTRPEYFSYLGSRYAENPNYINLIKKILNEKQ